MNVSDAIASRRVVAPSGPRRCPGDVVAGYRGGAPAPSGGNPQPGTSMRSQAARGLVGRAFEAVPHPRGEDRVRHLPVRTGGNRACRVATARTYMRPSVAREDKPGRLRQFARNYELFGAPVGLFFT